MKKAKDNCGISVPHTHGPKGLKDVQIIDSHGHSWDVKEDWSKEWLAYVTTYVERYCPDIKNWQLISIAGNLEQVVIHNKRKFKKPFQK